MTRSRPRSSRRTRAGRRPREAKDEKRLPKNFDHPKRSRSVMQVSLDKERKRRFLRSERGHAPSPTGARERHPALLPSRKSGAGRTHGRGSRGAGFSERGHKIVSQRPSRQLYTILTEYRVPSGRFRPVARADLRLPANVPGDLYVDSTCIDCATCRQMQPAVFAQGAGHSFVARQPETREEEERALQALVACPTGSIGTRGRADGTREASRSFPESVGGDVFFCGYTSEKSFGAWSWLIRREGGNVLVDSPRAAAPLLARLEELGGVATMFLPHRA